MTPELQKIHRFDEVYDSQKVFRLILTAVSNPTRVVNIGLFAGKFSGENPGFLAVAMTLLDNEVTFSTCGDEALAEEVVSLTLAEKTRTEQADYIFVPDPALLAQAVESAKCGTLRDPHRSAAIIVKNSGESACHVRLYGPGIDGTAEFAATKIVKTALDLRDQQFYEYPQGVDFIFVSGGGELFAIPRLALREAE